MKEGITHLQMCYDSYLRSLHTYDEDGIEKRKDLLKFAIFSTCREGNWRMTDCLNFCNPYIYPHVVSDEERELFFLLAHGDLSPTSSETSTPFH